MGDVLVVAGTMVGVVLLLIFNSILTAVADRGQDSSSINREQLRRDSDYVTVVSEDETGYGTAVRECDGGLDIISFNSDDRIYQQTWVPGPDLDALANIVSVHACQQERDHDE